MDRLDELTQQFESFKRLLIETTPKKRATAIKNALTNLKKLSKSLEPPKKELKAKLMTHPTAIEIREIYADNKRIIDLKPLADDLGLTLKKPTIDHILIGHFYPTDRLNQLADRFREMQKSDPARGNKQLYQEWRGRLRSLGSQDLIAKEVERLIEEQGTDQVRGFAAHVKTKELTSKRKLAKNASVERLVAALAGKLWSEKMTSRAQEGTL
ncbi:hypothetical protein ACFL2Q_09405 [Thermodesulfobacteriota bacterium]